MSVQILRCVAGLLGGGLLALNVWASHMGGSPPVSEPPTPPPGIPASSPDIAPLPPEISSPAYDAIRQRCAIALDERSCIEAAMRNDTRRRRPEAPAH